MDDERDQYTTRETALDPDRIPTALDSDDPSTRRTAIDAFDRLVRSDVDAAMAYIDPICEHLNDENLVVARGAGEALEPIARERPDALVGRLDEIVAMVGADTIDLSLVGANLLSPIAVDRPEAISDRADSLVAILLESDESPDASIPETVQQDGTRQAIRDIQQETHEKRLYVRRTAANAVVAAVESDPSNVTDVAAVESLLDDTDPGVVAPAVDTLGQVAAADPSRVMPARDSLVECLEHEQVPVRARAVRTLGYLGDESVVPALRDLENDDEIGELAAETAAFLAAE